jgi:stage IV sporulation protein FB
MKIAKIKIHYSLIFLLILSLFTGSFFKILGIIISILIHEFSHYVFLKIFKVNVKNLELSIIGGILEINDKNISLIKRLLINSAGVISNLIIILLIKITNINSLNYLVYYNLFIIIFNLIPIIPLDGFRILNDLLSSIYDDNYTFIIIKKIDSFCLIMMLIILLILKIYGLLLIWCYLLVKYFKYNIDDKKIKNLYYLLKK